MSHKNYYFCNINFGEKLTGIERSSFKRALLFEKYLNITPHFITANLNINIRKNWEHFKTIGWVPKNSQHINIYDNIMEIELGRTLKPTSIAALETETCIQISPLHNRYNQNRKMHIFIHWKDEQHIFPNFINYFAQGKKFKRDLFNIYGQLAISQYFNDEQKIYRDELFKPNQTRCMVRHYDKNGRIKLIELIDHNCIPVQLFNNEAELIEYWLKEHIHPSNIYIMDKNRIWSGPLSQLRKNNDFKIISIFHSAHLLRPYENIMAGGLNANYKNILTGEHYVDRCIILTPQQKDDIVQRFNNIPPISMIPHGQDQPCIKVNFNQRNQFKLISLTRLSEEKQIDHMIKVMEIVVEKNPQVQLYVFGEGAERKKLEELIKEKKLENHVFLAGYTENISAELNNAMLYLSTSKVEGFPLALLEALNHGLPLVCYDTKYGPQALIHSGLNGEIVERNNIEAMASTILHLLSDHTQLSKMSNAAYDIAEQFSMENMAKIWKKELELY